jgi:hypothetical protein
MGEQLLRAPLSADDRLAVERALNTLSIPGARSLTGPWSKSDPLTDAEQDILGVKQKIENRDRATGQATSVPNSDMATPRRLTGRHEGRLPR